MLAGRLKPLLAGRFLPLLQPDESRGSHLPLIVLVGGHSCPIQLIQSCLKALLPKLNPRVGFCLCRNPMRAEALIYPLLPTAYLIPFSVMIAVIYFAGVISKAGFRTSTSKGAMHLPIILVTS